jgi:NitT/TauT family transport system permease protein
MRNAFFRFFTRQGPPLLLAAVAMVVWQAAHHALEPERRFLLPSLPQLAGAFRDHGAELARAAGQTAVAALGGFAAAAVVAALVSLVLVSSVLVRRMLYPYVMGLQMVPVIVVAPILILWLGAGQVSVIVVTFLITFFPLVVNTTQGLLSVEQAHVDLFRMARARRWQELLLLRAPAALPYFFTGLRIAAILAPIGALTADYLVGSTTGGRSGLGIQALLFSARNEIPALYATALTGCVLGFTLVGLVAGLAWAVLHRWHDSYSSALK